MSQTTAYVKESTLFQSSPVSTPTPATADTSPTTGQLEAHTTSLSGVLSTQATQDTETSQGTVFTQEATTLRNTSISTETALPPETSHTSALTEPSTVSPRSPVSTHSSQNTDSLQTTVFTEEATTSSGSSQTALPPETSFTAAPTEASTAYQSHPTSTAGIPQSTVFTQESTASPTSTVFTETAGIPETSYISAVTEEPTASPHIPTSTQTTQDAETSTTLLTHGPTLFPSPSVGRETPVPTETSHTSPVSEASTTHYWTLTSTQATQPTETSEVRSTHAPTTFPSHAVSTETALPLHTSPTTGHTEAHTTSLSGLVSTQAPPVTRSSQGTGFTQEWTTLQSTTISTETAVPPETTYTTSQPEESSTSTNHPISTQDTQGTDNTPGVFPQDSTTFAASSVSPETAVPTQSSHTTHQPQASTTYPSSPISTQATQAPDMSQTTAYVKESTLFQSSPVSTPTPATADTSPTTGQLGAHTTSLSGVLSTQATQQSETSKSVSNPPLTAFSSSGTSVSTRRPFLSSASTVYFDQSPVVRLPSELPSTTLVTEGLSSSPSSSRSPWLPAPSATRPRPVSPSSYPSLPSNPTSTHSPTSTHRPETTVPGSEPLTSQHHLSSLPVHDSSPSQTGPPSSSPPSSAHLPSPYSTVPVFSGVSSARPPFPRTPPASVTTPHSSLPPQDCHNGKWNGHQCECKSGYTGQLCDSILYSFPVEIPNVVNATVSMIVKVTNRNFTSDMKNKSSEAYKNFQNLFLSQMDKVYEGDDLPQYKEVIIRELLNGSIVVESDVILEASYTPEYQTLFRNLTKIVRNKIMNETRAYETDTSLCQNAKLCYNTNFTTVDMETIKFSFSPAELCNQKAAEDFGQYFYPEVVEGRLTCVNNCTQGAKSQLNCNLGRCQLLRSGPHCVCPNTDTHWYWGETCQSRASKRLVYGLAGTVLAVLLVLVVLAVFLGRSQRRQHRAKYNPSQAWQRETLPGTFKSTGVWEGQNLKEDKLGLEKGRSHFQPNLQHVHPDAELSFQSPKVVKSAAP
ncbi:mucin-12 isoform X2 [Mesocricetus auratus]|uniref:Mucin-12 isoform X2 n=1 Tax=Mesocricetus auratus TaxID=10036 RepID=A0ABM2WDH9_MESAU|nr:mucin-12 isoform X2 [Mesocricetus auratus]